MIFILKNKGKGNYGLNNNQVTADDLALIETEDVRLKAQTLLVANWVLNGVSGLYEYTFADARVTAESEVEFIPYVVSEGVVATAEIKTHTPTSAGQVLIQAVNVPTADVVVDVIIKTIKDV